MADANSTGAESLTVLAAARQIDALGSLADAPPEEPARVEDVKPEGEESAGEDAKPEEEQPAGEEEQPEGEEPTGEEEEKPEPKAEPLLTVLNEDGTEEQVTRDEARKRGLRMADYTRKTQEVARHRQEAETEKAELVKAKMDYLDRVKRADQALAEAVGEPNWAKIREEQPDQYPTLQADWNLVQQQRKKLQDEAERVQQDLEHDHRVRFEARRNEEARRLRAAVPDLADPIKGPAWVGALMTYGEGVGFTKQEVESTVDHRLFLVLDKARRYDALQAAKAKLPAKPAPKPQSQPKAALVPGAERAPSNAKTKQREEAVKQAARSGKTRDAARAIAALDI